MTNKEKFSNYMEKQGFEITDGILMGTLPLIPEHRVSDKGDHSLIREIKIVAFDGSDTPEGQLGCVTLCYHGMLRKKYHRPAYLSEILKKAFCPKSCQEAIETFEKWKIDTAKTLTTWKVII